MSTGDSGNASPKEISKNFKKGVDNQKQKCYNKYNESKEGLDTHDSQD